MKTRLKTFFRVPLGLIFFFLLASYSLLVRAEDYTQFNINSFRELTDPVGSYFICVFPNNHKTCEIRTPGRKVSMVGQMTGQNSEVLNVWTVSPGPHVRITPTDLSSDFQKNAVKRCKAAANACLINGGYFHVMVQYLQGQQPDLKYMPLIKMGETDRIFDINFDRSYGDITSVICDCGV